MNMEHNSRKYYYLRELTGTAKLNTSALKICILTVSSSKPGSKPASLTTLVSYCRMQGQRLPKTGQYSTILLTLPCFMFMVT